MNLQFAYRWILSLSKNENSFLEKKQKQKTKQNNQKKTVITKKGSNDGSRNPDLRRYCVLYCSTTTNVEKICWVFLQVPESFVFLVTWD